MIEDSNNLDRAVFDVGQILADLDHRMIRSQRDLELSHSVEPFFLINSLGRFISKFNSYYKLYNYVNMPWRVEGGP